MSDVERKMRLIQSLDRDAHIDFSPYTGKWYVSARVEIGDGAILSGITEHQDHPEDAVRVFFERLTTIDLDQFLATTYAGQRREWQWNGGAFAECTRDLVFEQELVGARAVRDTP